MVVWRLKNTMDMYGITRYALQKESGVAMNTVRGMYDGETRRPDLDVLNTIIFTLRKMTNKDITLTHILEWEQ